MTKCSNLYYLSTIACALADYLEEDELSVLAADLVVLSDMLANIIARNEFCQTKKAEVGDSIPGTLPIQ